MFTEKQLEIVELLKEMTINEAYGKLDISRGAADKRLFGIRNKIANARRVVNISNNWMQNKRLAKLLRRQE